MKFYCYECFGLASSPYTIYELETRIINITNDFTYHTKRLNDIEKCLAELSPYCYNDLTRNEFAQWEEIIELYKQFIKLISNITKLSKKDQMINMIKIINYRLPKFKKNYLPAIADLCGIELIADITDHQYYNPERHEDYIKSTIEYMIKNHIDKLYVYVENHLRDVYDGYIPLMFDILTKEVLNNPCEKNIILINKIKYHNAIINGIKIKQPPVAKRIKSAQYIDE
jgi:hypothetical protein